MEIDDLLKLSFDEAVEMPDVNGRLFISFWEDARYLKHLEKAYFETKDGAIILEAIFVCSMNNFLMPKWLQKAYRIAYRKVRQYKAGSWAEVFGRPHSKGTQLSAKRELREKKYEIYFRIKNIIESEPKTPIDGYLFERVGREFGIGGKTKISEIYYKIKKNQIK